MTNTLNFSILLPQPLRIENRDRIPQSQPFYGNKLARLAYFRYFSGFCERLAEAE
jgi:hypothetical protein